MVILTFLMQYGKQNGVQNCSSFSNVGRNLNVVLFCWFWFPNLYATSMLGASDKSILVMLSAVLQVIAGHWQRCEVLLLWLLHHPLSSSDMALDSNGDGSAIDTVVSKEIRRMVACSIPRIREMVKNKAIVSGLTNLYKLIVGLKLMFFFLSSSYF
ncbi:hypothetical protein ES332_A09G021800v1 [Gossypium tomentosum]|uniref:Uncharacterized protein n=1 Tax=Gossypium tomentosum TaxID=34277 RepID=A0A5D2NXE1_GOSTO|nr:hypothetical protein ES332_A09G021800v1 [Gossypium tomentosum]